jgi:hypothetical protein
MSNSCNEHAEGRDVQGGRFLPRPHPRQGGRALLLMTETLLDDARAFRIS